MDVQAISNLIDCARKHEEGSSHLQSLVCQQLEQLHHTIELPEDMACETLLKFADEYIDHVPNFLEALDQASRELEIENFISPFLSIAEENFLAPVLQSHTEVGLFDLLDKAYFAHRLIEEVNDSYLSKTGCTLIPMNMTWANLIIHAILGEEFGNELDRIVEQTVRQMMRSQEIYNDRMFKDFVNNRNPEQWVSTWSKWNCLSSRMGIELKFTSAA
ncbi:hypothetical protein [Endozoicomonas arenosclerae]|uniref:hypothetical protein n=1 Tax=Endozoicomonas arenosclerae TaxID=1633495 RepID=UPI000A8DBA5F|nr:hypothetical protein [Endozoicomonas arenosclerae]